jgi:hypothetical protein
MTKSIFVILRSHSCEPPHIRTKNLPDFIANNYPKNKKEDKTNPKPTRPLGAIESLL